MGKFGLKHLFIFSLFLSLFSWYKYSYTYKQVSGTLPETHQPPVQTALTGPVSAPACCKGTYCWQFTPLYDYSVTGLVFGVSHKLASQFDDVVSADVGLLWGENSAKELYKDVKLRVMLDHYEAWWKYEDSFNMHEAANTHMLSCDPDAFSGIKKIRPGDQVRVRGWLADVKLSEEPGETDPRKIRTWKTSSSRDDKGDGACEVLYVRSAGDIEILKKGPRRWYWLRWLGAAGMLLSVVLWQRRLKRQIAETQKIDF